MFKVRITNANRMDYKALEIGEIGISHAPGFEGHLIIRAFNGYIDLSNPVNTWTFEETNNAFMDLNIVPLPKGSLMTLEVM